MISKCGRCGGALFELKENEPNGSNFKINFIQCCMCGTPIGTMGYFDTYTTIVDMEKRINKKFQQIESMISSIDYNMKALTR